MTLLSYQVSSSFLWPVMATCTLPLCSNFFAQSLPSTYNASFISVLVNIYFLRPSSSPTFFWNFLPLSFNSQGLAGSLLSLPANNWWRAGKNRYTQDLIPGLSPQDVCPSKTCDLGEPTYTFWNPNFLQYIVRILILVYVLVYWECNEIMHVHHKLLSSLTSLSHYIVYFDWFTCVCLIFPIWW